LIPSRGRLRDPPLTEYETCPWVTKGQGYSHGRSLPKNHGMKRQGENPPGQDKPWWLILCISLPVRSCQVEPLPGVSRRPCAQGMSIWVTAPSQYSRWPIESLIQHRYGATQPISPALGQDSHPPPLVLRPLYSG
jgi:hypothetical protein